MSRSLGLIGKGLQALGMLIVLVGLVVSIGLGSMEQGLHSMWVEIQALCGGLILFALGTLLLRRAGPG